jgi:hypothetical protein
LITIGGKDSIHNREEQVPTKPRESENPTVPVQTRKITIKGHRPQQNEPQRSSEEIPLRERQPAERKSLEDENIHALEEPHTIKPKKNNLIVTQGGLEEKKKTDGEALARSNLDEPPKNPPVPAARSGELPPVKSGKVPVRRTFKPPEIQQQDFEGM